MAERPKKRRLHIGEGAEADKLIDLFHDLRGSVSVLAFSRFSWKDTGLTHSALNVMVDFVN